MKRVVFFIEPDWALGSIHYELGKRLWPYGFDCQVLPWNKVYNHQEIQELNESTDLWVTLPQGWDALKSYNINSPEKTILVCHATVDLFKLKNKISEEEFAKFHSIAAVSEFLIRKAEDLGINRYVKLAPVCINSERFYCKPSLKLKRVGYGGFFVSKEEHFSPRKGEEMEPKYTKRSYLAQEAALAAGLEFVVANSYHTTHVTMPAYYRTVDCVIIPSIEEGAGLPSLEAGASGRLVIGTAVGHWDQRVGDAGGIKMPLGEEEFLSTAVNVLKFYKDEPLEYQKRCWGILNHSKSYDWEHHILSLIHI